jgi:hypothetical protein
MGFSFKILPLFKKKATGLGSQWLSTDRLQRSIPAAA